MAFCPECGKPSTANATKCVHCGHDLGAKPGVAAPPPRFKGTMMMQAAPIAAPPAPAAAAVPPAASAAPMVAPPPAAAAAPVANQASAVPKPNLKATMVGQGMIAPPSAAAHPPAAAGPAGAPGEEGKKMAFAATQPQHAAQVATTTSGDPTPTDAHADGNKLLPGDPMAHLPSAAAQKHASHRGSVTAHGATPPSATKLIIVAIVGLLLIAGTGIGAAVYMGLLHFN